MSYDAWKLRNDRDEDAYACECCGIDCRCAECGHSCDACDCPCCHEEEAHDSD